MIGILALQGDVGEHRDNLEQHGARCRLIRQPADLGGIEALVLPGGESTAMERLIGSSGLKGPVSDLIRQGLPVWGTCAGVILLAEGGPWHCVDIEVQRNAYGPQLYSRVAMGTSTISDKETRMVFIRAPRIRPGTGKVEVLSELEGDVVAARQQNILLTTFHPELIADSPFTAYFLKIKRSCVSSQAASP